VETIECNHKSLKEARKQNGSVAIRIKGEPNITAGRHFTEKEYLASIVTPVYFTNISDQQTVNRLP